MNEKGCCHEYQPVQLFKLLGIGSNHKGPGPTLTWFSAGFPPIQVLRKKRKKEKKQDHVMFVVIYWHVHYCYVWKIGIQFYTFSMN